MKPLFPTFIGSLLVGLAVFTMGSFAHAQELPGEMVGYWNFDSDIKDATGNGLNGTMTGGSYIQGITGEAVLLDGERDQIVIPHNDRLNLNTYTITMWIRSDDNKMYSNLLRKGNDEQENYKVTLKFGGRVVGYMKGANGLMNLLTRDNPVEQKQWHFLAMTFDGSDWKIFLDGKVIAEYTFDEEFTPTFNREPLVIGNEVNIYNRGFKGAMDEVKLYDYVVSQEDLMNEYEELLPDPTRANLLSHFAFEGDARDIMKTGIMGAIKGPTFRDGKVGKALFMLGRDEYTEIPHTAALDLNSYTIELWAKVVQHKRANYLYTKGGPGNENFDLAVGERGELYGFMKFEDGVRHYFRSHSGVITQDTWHHIVQTFDDNVFRLYVDGEMVYEKVLFGRKQPKKVGQSMYMGFKKLVQSSTFDGYIDELRIYNRGLTPAEVQGLLGSSLNDQVESYQKKLIGKWSFDSNLQDSSLMGNHAYSTVPEYKEGYKGEAVLFQDRNDYIRVADRNSLDAEQYTIAFWAKQNIYRNGRYVFIKGKFGNSNYEMRTRYNGGFTGYMTLTDGDVVSLQTNSNVIETGKWHHIAMSYKPGEWKIYVDGIVVAETSRYDGVPQINADFLYLGNSAPLAHDYYQGLLDEMYLYNYVLSAEEIEKLMSNTMEEKSAETVEALQGDGTTLLDNPSFEDGLKDWSTGGQNNEVVLDSLTGEKAIKMFHTSGSSNVLSQNLGVLKSGKTYKVSVAFKASPNVNAQLFFGDKAGKNPLDNVETLYKDGNDQWQRMEVTHTMSHDDDMGVYIYISPVDGEDGDMMIIDDVQIELVD